MSDGSGAVWIRKGVGGHQQKNVISNGQRCLLRVGPFGGFRFVFDQKLGSIVGS